MSDLKLSHPSRERLAAFVSGRLDPLEAGAIEDHLHGCAACRSSVAGLGSRCIRCPRCERWRLRVRRGAYNQFGSRVFPYAI